jgi:hypothetical protein
LRLPDLEHAKSAVLNSFASPESRCSCEFAIQNLVHWYCSEPRLALNRIVVTRYRMQLEQLHLAVSTINQRLAAVRRLAYEASDAGLLSPELAAGMKRVMGVKQLGVRIEIGSPQNRREPWSMRRRLGLFAENEIAPSSERCWDAAFADPNWFT